jgi:hypothetical protein
MLAPLRFSVKSLIEIGVCQGPAEHNGPEASSVDLWLRYFPFCRVIGVDLRDLSSLNHERFTSFIGDQSSSDDLRLIASKIEPFSVDVIIDDGSHASYDQQATFREFFALLRPGGLYFIENLDWQPPGEAPGITLTKDLFRDIQRHGKARSSDPLNISAISDQIADILFFDSQVELERRRLLGGLVAVRKCGGPGYVW